MAAHPPRLTALACALALALALVSGDGMSGSQSAGSRGTRPTAPGTQPVPRRIVSLVPALTEMLYAIGAGPQVVGVSSFDTFPPEVRDLPRVGALIDPDTERILTLRPDLVITYSSQDDTRERFERAGIRVFSYRHGGLAAMFETMRQLGEETGHQSQAADAVRTLESRLNAIRTRVRGRTKPRTMIVFERTPKTLRGVYASGGVGFLSEMLEHAGGVNVFADVRRESVQPSQETILTRAPQVILEIRASDAPGAADAQRDSQVWGALASVPAVRQRRIYFLSGSQLVVPGPRVTDGVEMMARALHPDAFR